MSEDEFMKQRVDETTSETNETPTSTFKFSTRIPLFGAVALIVIAVVILSLPSKRSASDDQKGPIVLAGKNFLESSILLELMAAVIKADHPDLAVEIRHYEGDSKDLYSSLRLNEIQIYAEYSGTLLGEHLGLPLDIVSNEESHDLTEINNNLRAKEASILFLHKFKLDNPFVMVMTRKVADDFGILGGDGNATISSLATLSRPLRLGTTQDFFDRVDGLVGLNDRYGLTFSTETQYFHEEIYHKLDAKEVDVVDGYGTDWQLYSPVYVKLEDDRKLFTYYYAGPLIRDDVIKNSVRRSLEKLQGKIGNEQMQRLLADAHNFLTKPSLLRHSNSAQEQLTRLVSKFLADNDIIPITDIPQLSATTTLDVLEILEPYNGEQILRGPFTYGYRRYELPPEDPRRVHYLIRRRVNGKLLPDDIDTSQPRINELPGVVGNIEWSVKAVLTADDDEVEDATEWTDYQNVQFYPNRWARICGEKELWIATAKQDGVFINPSKTPEGPEVDLLRKLVESVCDNDDIVIKRRSAVPWDDDYFNLLKNKDNIDLIDLLVSRISILKSREILFDLKFTAPYISYPQSILVRLDTNVLADDGTFNLHKLAAQSGTTNEKMARALLQLSGGGESLDERNVIHQTGRWVDPELENAVDKRLLALWTGDETDTNELYALLDGNIDGIVADQPAIENLYRQYPKQLDSYDITSEIMPGVKNEEIGFAVRAGDTELLEALNLAIKRSQNTYIKEFRDQFTVEN